MNKTEILKRLTEDDIWRKYLGHCDIGKMYRSPFRKDTNPSFGLYKSKEGRILFKDFGGDCGDVFQFIQTKFRINFQDALMLIEHEFNLSNSSFRPKTHKSMYSFADKILIKKKPAKFAWEEKVMDSLEYEYWAQFGIKPETLLEYNVLSIKAVKAEIWTWYLESTKINPIFCYRYPSGHVRFYRPLCDKGELKHFGNANGEDIFGLEQINKAVLEQKAPEITICITAGQKDALSLYSNTGIRTVSLNSESAILTKETYLKLSSLAKSIDIAYDIDETGRKCSDKLVKEYGFHDYMQNFYLKPGMKDISDYYYNLHKQTV